MPDLDLGPLADVLATTMRAHTDSVRGDMFTAMAGVVVAFDAAKCTADIRPAIRRSIAVDDDSDETEELPIIPDVPIVYPQGGKVRIRWALVPGDPVLLLALTLCATNWRLTGIVPSDPGDSRTHSLGSCVALPGFVPDVAVAALTVPTGVELTSLDGPIVVTSSGPVNVVAPSVHVQATDVRLGIDDDTDTHDKFVALSDKVDANFDALATTLGSGSVGGPGPVTFGSPYTPTPTAAARVKAR